MSLDYAAFGASVQEKLRQSPLRQKAALPHLVGLEELASLERDIAALIERLERRLSMVIMGEVKAGKSTLINAFAGGPVSPTNVLESTATILEIEYADTESATLEKHDGSEVKGSVREIFQLLERHRGDETFFAGCKVVRLGIPLTRLKRLRIVDTPGLATITESNAALAHDYIRHADVVLWVLNGLHLGQSDVIKEVAEVARLGKPIIAIINRVDQVDTAPSRLVIYVERELGIYVERVFPLSAKDAFDGVMNDNPRLCEESGFTELSEYLESEVNARDSEVKAEAIHASLQSIIRRELMIHESALRQLNVLTEKVDEHHQIVMLNSQQITQRLVSWLRNEVDSNLLATEYASIMADVNPSFDKIDRLLSNDAVMAWWAKKEEELKGRFDEEWDAATREFAESLRLDIEQFVDKERALLAEGLAALNPDPLSDAMEGATKGALAGGATGLGLAAYAAWLGPYAASVGLGTAAMAIVPPLAIAGAIGGVAYGMIDRIRKKRERERETISLVRSRVRDIRDAFKTEVLEAHVVAQLTNASEEVALTLHSAYVGQLTGGHSPEAMDQLRTDLQAYMDTIGLLEEKIPEQVVGHQIVERVAVSPKEEFI